MEKSGVIFDASWQKGKEETSFSEWGAVCRAGTLLPSSAKKSFSFRSSLRFFGNGLILASLLGLLLIFGPVLKTELSYQAKKAFKGVPQPQRTTFGDLLKLPGPVQALAAPNAAFSIVIPKIEAKAPIFANVDAADPIDFKRALAQGVAHAKGTFFPGMGEVIYLFAHSTDSPLNIARYNAVFFLLRELEEGDEILIFFNGKKFSYRVAEKMITPPGDTTFFQSQGEEILVLQTCWPPGTTWKRLLVLAKPV